MTTTQAIVQHLKALTPSTQREVLDFVEFLESRQQNRTGEKEDASWSTFSLAAAMHGMEDEPAQYSVADLKESFG